MTNTNVLAFLLLLAQTIITHKERILTVLCTGILVLLITNTFSSVVEI